MDFDLLEQKLKKIHSELSESTKKLEETAKNIYQKTSDRDEFNEIDKRGQRKNIILFYQRKKKNIKSKMKNIKN